MNAISIPIAVPVLDSSPLRVSEPAPEDYISHLESPVEDVPFPLGNLLDALVDVDQHTSSDIIASTTPRSEAETLEDGWDEETLLELERQLANEPLDALLTKLLSDTKGDMRFLTDCWTSHEL